MWGKKKKGLQPEDLDYVGDMKRAILIESPFWSNLLLYGIIVFLVVIVIWAHFAILDEVTTATGKVIPSSQIQVIQNLEGGILADIQVREGDTVEKGQVLLRIDDTRFSASLKEGESNYYALLSAIARLKAQVNGDEKLTFPKEVMQKRPDLAASELELFKYHKDQLDSSIGTLKKSHAFAKKELGITKPLVKEGLMSELELLRLQREVNELEGKIDAHSDKFRSTAQEELNKKESELNALKEALAANQDRVTRTTVRSPVRGTVKKVNVTTIGGVITPGMDIMEVVPLEDTLLVEARVRPSDIAFIHPGQNATVKFTAYDYAIYGGLDSVVEHISADTIHEPETDESFYKILVRTDRNYLIKGDEILPIISGMTVTVDILTGKKSVLAYLMKPLLRARNKALTER